MKLILSSYTQLSKYTEMYDTRNNCSSFWDLTFTLSLRRSCDIKVIVIYIIFKKQTKSVPVY